MNCKNCGELLEEGVTVCPGCGESCEAAEPVEEIVTETEVLEPVEGEVETAEETAEGESFEIISEEGTEVLLEETPEAASANPKRKTLLRVLAVVCCVALALSLGLGIWWGVNGGLKPRANNAQRLDNYYAEGTQLANALDTVIATCGDAKLTNGMLQPYYWNSFYRFLEEYRDYIGMIGLDVTASLADQYASEGVTYQQQFLASALNDWHSYQVLAQMGKEAGYVLSDSAKAQIEGFPASMAETASYYGFENADGLIQSEMGPGASLESYLAYMELYFYAMEYFDSVYLSINPSEEEIRAYYNANSATIDSSYGVSYDGGKLVDVRHILLVPKSATDSTEYTEEEWEACRKAAEEVLNQWKSGTADEESFAKLAKEHTEDPGSQATGGLYTNVYEGMMVPEFNDWCFDENRKTGDTGLVRTDYGYHVMYYVDGEPGWYRAAKQSMVSDECTKILQEGLEKSPMEVEYKKIRLGEAKFG